MLPSKDEGGWLLGGLALRGLLAQAPQGEGGSFILYPTSEPAEGGGAVSPRASKLEALTACASLSPLAGRG